MDPRLFSEWAQVDDHLRRAITARDTYRSGRQHAPRVTAMYCWPQTYRDWSRAEVNPGGSLFVMAREERGAYIRRKLQRT